MIRRFIPAILLTALTLALFAVPACEKKKKPALPPERERLGGRAAFHHTREILSYGPRPPESAALAKTRRYIIAELKKTGWKTTPHSFTREVAYFGRKMKFTNLSARFGDVSDEGIKGLLGAHLDSKYYRNRNFLAADDAASAIGAILELARQLQATPELASKLELVFFDGEEAFGQNISPSDGLYGSKEYALRWRTAPRKPSFGIVLDMIGHRNLQVRLPADTPPLLEAALLLAAKKEGEEARYTKALHPIIDDHVPLNNAGIPTIDIIGDFSQFAWWHTDGDNLNLISRESLEISLKVTRHMLEDLLTQQVPQ